MSQCLYHTQLGHETYRVGAPAYEKIVSTFGEGVRAEDGEIDRRALGAIVFSDKVSGYLKWDFLLYTVNFSIS